MASISAAALAAKALAEPPRPADPPLRRMPQLDGWRGIGVLTVIIHHYGLSFGMVAPAELMLRLFFTTSGFLITSIVLKQKREGERGPIDIAAFFRNFYIRRALRLMPALWIGIGLSVLLGVTPIVQTWPWHVFYLSNVLMAIRGDFLYPVGHLWTLAVEEQYYLLWPVLVMLLPARLLIPAVMTLIVAGPIWRIAGLLLGYPILPVSVMLPSVFDTLGIGSLLAILHAYAPQMLRHLTLRRMRVAALLSGGALIGVELLRHRAPQFHFVTVDALRAVLTFVIVQRSIAGFGGLMGVVLEQRLILWCGKTSYALYIFHQPIYWLVSHGLQDHGITPPMQSMVAVIAFLVTVAAGWLSWTLIETPVNSLKRFFPATIRARQLSARPA